jgi:hypothetical protein
LKFTCSAEYEAKSSILCSKESITRFKSTELKSWHYLK